MNNQHGSFYFSLINKTELLGESKQHSLEDTFLTLYLTILAWEWWHIPVVGHKLHFTKQFVDWCVCARSCARAFPLEPLLEASNFPPPRDFEQQKGRKAEPNEKDINQQPKYQWMKAEIPQPPNYLSP